MMNMPKVEIASTETYQRQGQKGPYWKQAAYLHTLDRDGKPNRYPERCLIMLPKDTQGQPVPYKVGVYSLAPNSIRIGKYSDIEIGFVNLVPVQAAQKAS